MGISPNEQVDALTKKGPYTRVWTFTMLEDARSLGKFDWAGEQEYLWINGNIRHDLFLFVL